MASGPDVPAHKKPRTASDPPLVTHAKLLSLADDSPSIIRVRDLQTTLTGPKDAWGRLGKKQPALVSVEVRLRHPFEASSAKDEVAGDTVHYGLLSKEILGFLAGMADGPSAALCVNALWTHLTGFLSLDGRTGVSSSGSFLKMDTVAYLCVSLKLPKASLLGDGVVVSHAAAFGVADGEGGQNLVSATARSLKIVGLRIPTLIGVNSNERMSRQVVTLNVDVQEMGDAPQDIHCVVEGVVVKETSESSFETLEALAHSIVTKMKQQHAETWEKDLLGAWNLGIELEKPVAVPFADAACVELRARVGL